MSQIKSDPDPLKNPEVAHAAAEVVRKAHAVGLIDDTPAFPDLTYPAVTRTVLHVREAGIGERAARELAQASPGDTARIAERLRELDALIEESPLPESEWPRVLEVLDRDQLAALLGISPASVLRYEKQQRATPDDVAARLHFLALVIGDLAGAYNAIGIRRWFDRTRTALDGRAPAAVLRGHWKPEDPGPRAVRALARALTSSPAT
jgi:hypothetical protein